MKHLWAPWRMEYIENEIDKPGKKCIFCEFPKANDDEKYLIPFRSEKCFVILNKFPYNNGHVLVVPYLHSGNYLELPDDVLLDLQQTIQKTIRVMKNIMNPHGFNVGMNIGRTAGAGIDEHLHFHIVPRWDGDTNFMPIISETKVVSESLQKTFKKFQNEFRRLYSE